MYPNRQKVILYMAKDLMNYTDKYELCKFIHIAEDTVIEAIKIIQRSDMNPVSAAIIINKIFEDLLELNFHPNAVELLANDHRVNLVMNDNYPIRIASQRGHVRLVKILLEDIFVNPTASNNEAIKMASQNGHAEIVELLIKDSRIGVSAKIAAFGIASRCYQFSVTNVFFRHLGYRIGIMTPQPNIDTTKDDEIFDNIMKKGDNIHADIIRLLTDTSIESGRVLNRIFDELVEENNHHDIIKLMLKDSRVDPCRNNNFALKTAATYGFVEILEILLQDARININVDDSSVIKKAAKHNHPEIIKVLLKNAKINRISITDAFLITCTEGYINSVTVLLGDPRLDFHIKDNDAVRLAIQYGHINIIEMFLQDSRMDMATKMIAFTAASENNRPQIIKLLLKNNTYPDTLIISAIKTASINHYSSVIKLLIIRCDVALLTDQILLDIIKVLDNDTSNETESILNKIFDDIIEKNIHHDVMRVLLFDPRINPNYNSNYAIIFASQQNHAMTLSILLESPRVDPDDLDCCALGIASQHNHTEIVKLLLNDERIIFNAGYIYAIKIASKLSHTQILNMLIAKHDLHQLTNQKIISIIEVLKPNSTETVTILNKIFRELVEKNIRNRTIEYLLNDARVDPAYDDNYAIIVASKNDYLEVARILLRDSRVDPSAQYNIAIGMASQNGNYEFVKILLQDPRVDPSVNNNYALNIAARNESWDIVKLLIPRSNLNWVNDKRILDMINERSLSGKQPSKKNCCVCFSQIDTKYVLFPCGHTNTCFDCIKLIKKCPICNTTIDNFIKLYD